MRKNALSKHATPFWVKLGAWMLRRRPNGTEFMTGRANRLVPSRYLSVFGVREDWGLG